MHLDILIDMKLLLCSATSPRIALAILAKQSADFAFLYRFFYIVIAMEAAAVSLFLPLLFLRVVISDLPKKYMVWLWRLYFCGSCIRSRFPVCLVLFRRGIAVTIDF